MFSTFFIKIVTWSTFSSFHIGPECSKDPHHNLCPESAGLAGRARQITLSDIVSLESETKKKPFSWSVGSSRQAGRRLQRRAGWQRDSVSKCCPKQSKEREKVRTAASDRRTHAERYRHNTDCITTLHASVSRQWCVRGRGGSFIHPVNMILRFELGLPVLSIHSCYGEEPQIYP